MAIRTLREYYVPFRLPENYVHGKFAFATSHSDLRRAESFESDSHFIAK